MKTGIFLLIFVFAFLSFTIAQPANDECTGAINLTNLSNWCSSNGAYTNATATQSISTTPACWTPAPSHDVWFKFTAIGGAINIAVDGTNGGGTLLKPQIVAFTGNCSTFSFTEVGCVQFTSSNTGYASLYISGLNIGQEYYFVVDGFNTNTGTFKLCINNFDPPVTPGQDCSSASILCNKNTITQQILNGYGSIKETSNTCMANSDKNSAWYKFTCATGGTLTFTIDPLIPNDDIDWVLFDFGTSGACSATNSGLRCNASSCEGPTGIKVGATQTNASSGCSGITNELWCSPPTLVAGRTYGLIINNWTDASVGLNNGYTLSFEGSATFVGPVSNFTISPSAPYCISSTISFTNTSTGSPTIYNWNFGSGASPASANTPGPHNVTYSTPGTKTIVLTVGNGSCEDISFQTIDITNCCVAPSVTSQPTPLSQCSGTNATFNVVASGTAPLTYQWQLNGTNITGATNSTLSLNNISSADAGNYTCVVTNACGNTTSSQASLTLAAGPTITSQPISLTKCEGQSASFSVIVSGTATYQWQLNGVNISGATNSTYNIALSSSSDAGSYTCVLTTTCGNITSNAATLSLNTSPQITSQPITLSQCSGTNASYSVVASGTAPLTYQWQLNGVNITGATNSTLSLNNISSADAGNYTCVVTNACGNTTSSQASLTLAAGPAITSQPISLSKCEGQAANFSVAVSGTATYQWQLDGVNISGATNSTYNITSASSGDVGSYTCIVSTSCGNITSNAAALSLNTSPQITSQPTSISQCSGTNASFIVGASGTAPLTYQWQLNGVNITGATNSTISLNNISSADAGNYTCVVTNSCGTINSNNSILVVVPNISIVSQPSDLITCENSNANFSVSISGTGNTTFQWMHNGVNITGASNSTLSLNSISQANAGQYSCSITSTCGSIVCNSANLIVNTQPTIVQQPIDKISCIGSNTAFSVLANGSSPLYYQWQYNGANLQNEINSVLNISNITSANFGQYSCIISNSCGAVISNFASLNGNSPIAGNLTVTDDTICTGSSVTFNLSVSGGNGGPYIVTNQNGQTVNFPYTTSYSSNSIFSINVNDDCGSTPVSLQQNITVIDIPDVVIVSDIISGCEPLTVQFNESSGLNNMQYLWNFNDYVNNTSSLRNPQHAFNQAGLYDISLTVKSSNGCSKTFVKEDFINVYSVPNSQFIANPNTASIINADINFFNYSDNASSYIWNFGNGETSYDENPVFDYNNTGPGLYKVSLIAFSDFGCSDTANLFVNIKDEYTFYAPNAFSPDNDNVNDRFFVMGNGIDPTYFQMYIYNRWGEMIYQTNQFNKENPAMTGWDGTVKGSSIAEQGTYAWTVIYKDEKGAMHERAGVVTVVR